MSITSVSRRQLICSKKIGYDTEKDIQKAAVGRFDSRAYNTYKCPECGRYHFSRKFPTTPEIIDLIVILERKLDAGEGTEEERVVWTSELQEIKDKYCYE